MKARAALDQSGLWRGEPIVLASKSHGRAALLSGAGVPFVAVDSGLDEREIEGKRRWRPVTLARKLAVEKARKVAMEHKGRVVIGADQVLALDDVVIHKATNIEQAKEQLRSLRGRRHKLHSAVGCIRDGDILFSFVETATIEMRSFDELTLAAYATAMDDALLRTVGGYEIEGLGVNLISRIRGDFFTVVGLPVLRLLEHFRRLGLIHDESIEK